jgi:hypothetical protein
MQKSSLNDNIRSWGLPPPPQSKERMASAKQEHVGSADGAASKGGASLGLPNSSTNTIPRSATWQAAEGPGVYIGPPKKRVGRPGKGKEKEKRRGRDENQGSEGRSTATTTTTTRMDPYATQTPDQSSSSSASTSLHHLLFALSSADQAQNAALLSALSAIDAPQSSTPSGSSSTVGTGGNNEALVAALRDVLATAATHSQKKEKETDDEVVLLDKENVNPSKFRRRGDGGKGFGDGDAMTVGVGMGKGSKENVVATPTGMGTTRKRTLSQFMEEKERESSKRSLRHAQTSPPRPTPQRRTGVASASSPPKGAGKEGGSGAEVNENGAAEKKKYVVPEWARTNTRLMPRLSKEVEDRFREEEEREKREREEKEEGRRARRKRGSNANSSTSADLGSGEVEGPRKVKKNKKKMVSREGGGETTPTILSLPVFASSQDSSFPTSSQSSTSSPRASSSRLPPAPPQTPPRKRSQQEHSQSHKASSSLFTPTPKAWTGSALFGASPLFSPSKGKGKSSSRTQMSPIRAVVSGKGGDFWSAEEREELGDDPEADEEELMTKELEMALEVGEEDGDELSNSLPVASSDIEVPPDTSYDEFSDDHLGSDRTEVQPHWSIGLPPSSPPPASSPSLTPQSDGDDLEDLDLLSGFDSDGAGMGDMTDFSSNASQYSDDLSMCLDELSTIFSDPDFPNMDIGMAMGIEEDLKVQNGIMDFDFTQFWESVKPLVGGGDEGRDAGDGEIDHGRLADEVQALFNGCLV